MAFTLNHTEGNALDAWSDASPAQTITAWHIIDAGPGSFYDYINVVLSIAMDGNVDGPGVDILVAYSANSSDMSDANIAIFNIPAENATVVYAFQLRQFNYLKIGVLNKSTTQAEVTPTGFWEGVKVTDS